MNSTVVAMEQVSFEYENGRQVLHDISFCAKKGESIGIVGANGVGKSTFLKLMVGLHLDFTGTITVNDLLVSKENLAAVREKTGYIFQDSDNQLFMSKVYDDIAFAPRNYGLSEDEVQQRVKGVLAQLAIEHLSDKHIYKMSGGEKKMVSIATILSMAPDLMLMDEPTIALDPRNRRNLIRILNGLTQTRIIATHDLDMVLDTCERTVLMSKGHIIKDGATKEILTDKALLEQHNLELPLCMGGTHIAP
ncbi:MAG: energy-coupling factor ABC transporter ATP-binding protein [Lachnospiraceae bacterium]